MVSLHSTQQMVARIYPTASAPVSAIGTEISIPSTKLREYPMQDYLDSLNLARP